MPEIVMHNHFGNAVCEGLKEEVKRKVKENENLYLFGTTLPNAFRYESFYNKEKRRKSINLSEYMQTHNVRKYFGEMIELTKLNKDLFSLLCGQITAFYLDIIVNPFIYYRSGLYKKDIDNSIKYRGFVQKTNLGIDCYMMDNYYHGAKHNYFSIRHKCLKLRKLPKTIEQDINKLYLDTFEIKEAYKKINKVISDQKWYYTFIHDPFGIKNKIFVNHDDGKSEFDYNYMSYYNKLIDAKKFDIFNLKHDKWGNPCSQYYNSIDSLFDLIDKAKDMSVRCIEALYKHIFLDEDIKVDYYIGDFSYITAQSNNTKSEMKYFNCIYK